MQSEEMGLIHDRVTSTSTYLLSASNLTDSGESFRGSVQNCVHNQTCSKSRREHGGDVGIDIGLSLRLINKPSESVQNIIDSEAMPSAERKH